MQAQQLFSITAKIGDLTDTALKALGITKSKAMDFLSKTKSDSLTKQVAGSISVFPVIITSDIPVTAATVITNALELEYANYLSLSLANSPRISISDINSGKYLQNFHTNLSKLESALSEVYDSNDPIESSMACSLMESITENIVITKATINKLNAMMKEAMEPEKEIYGLDWLMEASKRPDLPDSEMFPPPKDMNERSARRWIDDENKRKHTSYQTAYQRWRDEVSDDTQKERDEYQRDRDARKDRQESSDRRRSTISDIFKTAEKTAKDISSEKRAWDQFKYNQERDKKRDQWDEETRKDDRIAYGFDKTYNFKSINDMQAIPVVANIFTVDANGTPSRQIQVVSGVKAKLHPINKQELYQLVTSEDRGNLLSKIIRFASGEKTFFKEILSGGIKEYAAKMSKFHSNGAKVLGVLRRVKDLNRRGGNYKPNATLVVSKAVVDEIKRKVGIDLMDEDEAISLCDDLSLIKFMISDPIGGKLYTLMPGFDDKFSVRSTDTLERQIDDFQNNSKFTKELRRIMSDK